MTINWEKVVEPVYTRIAALTEAFFAFLNSIRYNFSISLHEYEI